MRINLLRGALGLIAVVASLGGCAGGSDTTGAAGSSSPGAAGSSSPGAAGSSSPGAAGVGAAGTGSPGAAGAGTAGTGAPGTAGTSATAGAVGTAGVAGTAGTTGTSGTAGSQGTAGSGAANTTAGCAMQPAVDDSQTNFVKKEIMVSGVDATFIAKYPPNAGSKYSWTKRNYYLRLPKSYSPDQPYAIDMAGTGCGGNETSGSAGEYVIPPGAAQTEALQVALSFVTSSAANPNCVGFTDDYVNSPEPQYINAVIDDVSAKYCVSKAKVFVNGYSSGAWEAIMTGCTNQDRVRAFGVQIGGGLRMHRPACMPKPSAAMFVVGLQDTANPIGPLTVAQNDSLGSAPARDELLMRNGCTGTATGPWNAAYPKCVMYTGCPAKYPVVWCAMNVNHGNGPNPMGTDGGTVLEGYRRQGLWEFFKSLPPP
jgi:poly(3-hydroxybutyrate) depolymerase